MPDALASYRDITLGEALDLNAAGVHALLRHATAALLNATHERVAYPITAGKVIELTNAALSSGDAATIEALKTQFDEWNNLGADLDQQGQSSITAFTISEIWAPWLIEEKSPADYLFFDSANGTFVPRHEKGGQGTMTM